MWAIDPDPEFVSPGQELRRRAIPLCVERTHTQHSHSPRVHRIESADQNLVVGGAQYNGNPVELVVARVKYVATHGFVPACTDSPQ
jgi:hypothetical protein